jgi:5S rRNA maturation endonuclease (ribonuclease M5)
MTLTVKILLFIGLLAYYYFVLRKYNSLGFRMFSLFSFVAIAVVYWWYEGYRDLESLKKNGVFAEANVTKKYVENTKTSNVPDNVVVLTFTDKQGKSINAEAREFTSKEEYAAVSVGQKVPAVYDASKGQVQLKSTFERSLNDYNYILIFPAILFSIGLGCMIFLRKYKVQPHEGTVYEYLTDENGKVVLDDMKSETTRTIKKINLVSKIVQAFAK